ncbi:Chromosome (plasmid) partitioning protein ParA [Klebsiella pneumoniae IS39]|jgi:DNA-binding XRE family transcriptional regulator|uniref:Chromosome (Plasmid) partitioning protein n=1 Tax=Klebsiella phage Kpn74 TaxID=3044026 RepID=A0AAT9V534_9CAUD|nr:chromosome (plasmid) partitioning protein [Klebsiella phage Kpn74]CDL63501.1 Chromosome (plasmid) partitioning protein ParA [Klebsiella pneumoniae IS39]
MSLINLLHECISRGQEMTQAIAIAQFGDDSPEARRITRRWGITEVADLIGVSPQAIRDAEKMGDYHHLILSYAVALNVAPAIPSTRLAICAAFSAIRINGLQTKIQLC